MNSEELEQSLRTEFEQHLRQVFADVRQEMSDLQTQIGQEFERHRAQLTEAFESFGARSSTGKELDEGFRESIVEHLRLARDEGARITATAIAEAEAMEKEAEEAEQKAAEILPKSAGVSELRNAVNDICAQTSQASILKSLVSHAGQFTPRGAFFIVKNEHLVGWRVFGNDEGLDGDSTAVRDIFFPVSQETSLGESLKHLSAVESAYGEFADDSAFLDKLEFGEPEKIIAIPLVARGRGVAVLYADKGENGNDINVEALETLVRVAGLTVEVLAAGGTAAHAARPSATPDFSARRAQVEQPEQPSEESYQFADERQTSEAETSDDDSQSTDYAQSAEISGESEYRTESRDDDYSAEENRAGEAVQYDELSNEPSEEYSADDDSAIEESTEAAFEAPTFQNDEFPAAYRNEPAETETYSWNQPAQTEAEQLTSDASDETESEEAAETEDYSRADSEAANQYQFEDAQSYASSENEFESAAPIAESEPFQNFETAQFDAQPSFEPSQSYDSGAANYGAFEPSSNGASTEVSIEDNFGGAAAESYAPVQETVKPARSRFSDRNIDLPVEVGEDERRLHNDARRFARLLVSEIKLYNEQKVKEGRDENDLYERLREAIDRSREMYDKRVQPPVAAKFDYFHYELVNSLADGDEAKLGETYVGAAV